MNDPSLILLVGMPRSGTTWIGKIFDSHPDTLYRHEPDSHGGLTSVPLVADVERREQYQPLVQEFIRQLPSRRSTKVAASLPFFPKSYYSDFQYHGRKFLVFLSKAAARAVGEFKVPDLMEWNRFPQLRLVWKSIESTGRLGVLVHGAADRKTVLILRHPCGYVSSVLRGESIHRFSDTQRCSEDYGVFQMLIDIPQASRRGLTLEVLKSLHPVERLAWRWVLFNEKAVEEIKGVDGCRYVRYEDVCREPARNARDLLEFTGLTWNRQTERFLSASTSRHSGSYYALFRDPLRAAYSWKEKLSGEDINRIFDVLRESHLAEFYSC